MSGKALSYLQQIHSKHNLTLHFSKAELLVNDCTEYLRKDFQCMENFINEKTCGILYELKTYL